MTIKELQPPQRRLLSIDGGGILGSFPAAFLAGLEQHLPKPTGSYFDLIAGTSTGGIIAVGLAVGLHATELGWSIPRRDGRRETAYRPQARAEGNPPDHPYRSVQRLQMDDAASSRTSRGLTTLSRVVATPASNPFSLMLRRIPSPRFIRSNSWSSKQEEVVPCPLISTNITNS